MKYLFTLSICMISLMGMGQPSGDEPFTYVEVMPSYPGGDAGFMKVYEAEFQPQAACRKEEKKAYVVLQFMVDTFGRMVNPVIIKGLECCDAEAVRTISKLEAKGVRWTPGSHNGKKVNVTKTLAVKCFPKNQAF